MPGGVFVDDETIHRMSPVYRQFGALQRAGDM